jgi:hypothetical protein
MLFCIHRAIHTARSLVVVEKCPWRPLPGPCNTPALSSCAAPGSVCDLHEHRIAEEPQRADAVGVQCEQQPTQLIAWRSGQPLHLVASKASVLARILLKRRQRTFPRGLVLQAARPTRLDMPAAAGKATRHPVGLRCF